LNKIYKHNVAIIGGGPAGAMAAIYLSKYDIDTCIIEKNKFPRDILCGEFLSCEVTEALTNLNLFDEFLKLSPVKIKRFKCYDEAKTKLSITLTFPAYSIKRSIFDTFLLNKAAEMGTKIYQPAKLQSIKKDGDKYLLKFKDSNNIESIIKSNFVIAAYGKQNIIDRILKRDFISKQGNYYGVKFHLPSDVFLENPPNDISIYFGREIYCGLNRVSADQTTLCFLEKRTNHNKSARHRLIELTNENEYFGNLFNNNFRDIIYDLPIYGTGSIYFGKRNVVENGIFMIGDAAGVIAPLTGDGIGMAFQSAELISRLLKDHLNSKINIIDLKRFYINEWQLLFSKRVRIASLIQNVVMQNGLRKFGLKVIKPFPLILRNLTGLSRSLTELHKYDYI